MFNFSYSQGGRRNGWIWASGAGGGEHGIKYEGINFNDLFNEPKKAQNYIGINYNDIFYSFWHFKPEQQIICDLNKKPLRAYRKTDTYNDTIFLLWDYGTFEPLQGFTHTIIPRYARELDLRITATQTVKLTMPDWSLKNTLFNFSIPSFHVYAYSYITRTRTGGSETPFPFPDFIENITDFKTSQYLQYMTDNYLTLSPHYNEFGDDYTYRNNFSLMVERMVRGGELPELDISNKKIYIPRGGQFVESSGSSSYYKFCGYPSYIIQNETDDEMEINNKLLSGFDTYKLYKDETRFNNTIYIPWICDTIANTTPGTVRTDRSYYKKPGTNCIGAGAQKIRWGFNYLENVQYSNYQNTLIAIHPIMTRIKIYDNAPLDI